MENQFETVSSSSKNVKTVAITYLAMAAIASLALIVSVAFFIFIEAILVMCCGMMLFITARVKWVLYFEDTSLYLTNMGNQRSFYLDGLKKSDFVFTQSNSQKEKNCANLKIVGSSAVIYDVQNYEELKAYLDNNFPI